MKFQIAIFLILSIFSTVISADWWNGWGNSNSNSYGTGNYMGNNNAYGTGNYAGDGRANAWGRGQGKTDGEVDFNITFKGSGNTNMASDVYGSGEERSNTNLYGYGNGYGNGYNNYWNNQPWANNNYIYPQYPKVPVAQSTVNTSTQVPSFEKIQKQMATQRKQAEEFYKKMQAQNTSSTTQ